MGKKNILQINLADDGGGAHQVSRFLHQSQQSRFRMQLLVEKKSTNLSGVHSFSENINQVIYQEYSYLVRAASHSLGINFYGSNALPHRTVSSFLSLPLVQNADLINLHNLHANYFNLSVLPKLTSFKPVVWSLHDMWAFTGNCYHEFDCREWLNNECANCHHYGGFINTERFLFQQKRAMYRQSKLHLVTPSQWLANKVSHSILNTHPLTVIPHGIDIATFHPHPKLSNRKGLELPLDKQIVLFIANHGTRNPWKGGKLVQRLMAENTNPDLYFVFIGEQTNSSTSISKNIKFIDDRDQLARYYSAADVLVNPSLADVSSLTSLEALACGTPVVTFQTGGIPEIISHLKDGYLAEYNDYEDLSQGLKKMLRLSKLHQSQIARNCTTKVRNRFSLELMTKKYGDLWTKLITTN